MSRPNGPVRHPGIPTPPEEPSHRHAHAPGDPNNPNYVNPNQNSGQPMQGQGHPPTSQAPYGQDYAQPAYQDPAPPQQPAAAPNYAQQDPAATSWADMNQPVPPNPNPAFGGDPQAYGQPAAVQQPAPSYQTQQQPTYDNTSYAQPQQSHYQQQTTPMPSTTPAAAPSGYDFVSYEAPQPAPSLDPNFQQGHDPRADWAQSEPSPGAGAEFGFATQAPGLDPHQQPVHVDDAYAGEDEDYEYEDDDEPSRGRGALIAAALAGAIVIGGGMAYGYQTIFGGTSSGKPPVVRGASGPAKVKPADPGGRKFAHTNSKIMGRLGSASGKTNDPAGGARRVSTLRIGRDGSVVAPTNPAATAGGSSRMVSGMTLGGTATTAAATPANAAPAKKPIVVKPPAAKAPVKVANVKPAAAKPPPVSDVKPPPVVKPVVKPQAQPAAKPAPKKVAVAKPAPTPAATGPKPTGAGYVAVLASVPVSKTSRMDSLKQFADMQQKYGTVLQNKTPDVQQANLGEKGTYHRLIAGPPGSAQSARSVCDGLKSAGYSSCWVLAY